ncbi:Eco57I restriction-modification methylase domain-containing protein [Corynebacterium sp. H78]|uniref:Eco57I restriction-modification methylase domain-containing protein n=1 Tax=Corynebacterium sp. H78 TaxID=3133417 RepID=UPI0030A1EBD0
MPKKFDVVIGNPPYQEEAKGDSNRSEPIYNKFMDAAYEVGMKIVLITPARFLTRAGQTPKAWNEKMLADSHLTVAHFQQDSSLLFPGTDIKGGIAVTYRDADREFGPIGTFTPHNEINNLLAKTRHEASLMPIVSPTGLHRFSKKALDTVPLIAQVQGAGTGTKITSTSVTALVGHVFFDDVSEESEDHVQIIGISRGQRVRRWVRRYYLEPQTSLGKWKVIIAKANNSGAFGETLSGPFVGEPNLAHTDSFMSVGAFDSEAEAAAALAYLKTKFSRALLSVLKTTQDNPKGKWKYVPAQDFSANSDIDWTKPIPEIDQQLYAKYGLAAEEIAFIEDNVKPME